MPGPLQRVPIVDSLGRRTHVWRNTETIPVATPTIGVLPPKQPMSASPRIEVDSVEMRGTDSRSPIEGGVLSLPVQTSTHYDPDTYRLDPETVSSASTVAESLVQAWDGGEIAGSDGEVTMAYGRGDYGQCHLTITAPGQWVDEYADPGDAPLNYDCTLRMEFADEDAALETLRTMARFQSA